MVRVMSVMHIVIEFVEFAVVLKSNYCFFVSAAKRFLTLIWFYNNVFTAWTQTQCVVLSSFGGVSALQVGRVLGFSLKGSPCHHRRHPGYLGQGLGRCNQEPLSHSITYLCDNITRVAEKPSKQPQLDETSCVNSKVFFRQ